MARACDACAGTGATCASDGFAACAACRGVGTRDDANRRDDCVAMTDDDDGTRDVAAALANLPLVDARGRAVNLSSGSDSTRPLLVACFTRDDCGACRAFAPRVVALAAARRDACDVVLIACDANNGYECVDRAVEASGTRDETLRAAEAREGDASYSRARETNFILRALGATTLPTVAVVHRGSGRVVTTWGRMAMYARGESAVEAWRRGESGLNPFEGAARGAARALASCARGT